MCFKYVRMPAFIVNIHDCIEQRAYVLRVRIVAAVCCVLHGRSVVAVRALYM